MKIVESFILVSTLLCLCLSRNINKSPPHFLLASSNTQFILAISLSPSKVLNRKREIWAWNTTNITLGWNSPTISPFNVSLPIKLTSSEENIYAHIRIAKPGNSEGTMGKVVLKGTFPLTKYKRKKNAVVLRNLITSSSSSSSVMPEDDSSSKQTSVESVANPTVSTNAAGLTPYWVPTLSLSVIQDLPGSFPRGSIPPSIAKHLTFSDDGAENYYPVLYHNTFWLTSKDYIEINGTLEEYPLTVSFAPLAFWKWSMMSSMEEQWSNQQNMNNNNNNNNNDVKGNNNSVANFFSGGGMTSTEKETDMIREMLLETNPILLVVTFVISLLHMVFDTLAFTSDIQFWRQKKSMVGMSLRSLVINCFFQTVILLYLYDNDTSTMILLSSAVGLLIEYWKLAKAFKVRVEWTEMHHLVQYPSLTWGSTESAAAATTTTAITTVATTGSRNDDSISAKNDNYNNVNATKTTQSAQESHLMKVTKQHDDTATDHLLYVLMPLVVGYAAYSLIYQDQKSFYSWFLNSLVGFVYAFGFILMTPQLFINYKLKSVAHMPWKAMVYKALNTFVDDLFAFIIKMPMLHRLACFRDDIIFFIYLYQKFNYKVDYSRENEFGQMGPSEEDNHSNANDSSDSVGGVVTRTDHDKSD